MKCCKCKKELDITDKSAPPKWFGAYEGWVPFKVICPECIKKPENDGWWSKK